MKTKLSTILLLISFISFYYFLISTPSSFAFDFFPKAPPKFVFQLGSTLDQIKKDPRTKNCKDLGEIDIGESKHLNRAKQLSCNGFENIYILKLLFFENKLIHIEASFHADEGPEIKSYEMKLFMSTEENANQLALLESLRKKCSGLGTPTKKKIYEAHAINGNVYPTFMERSTNSNYICAISYTIYNIFEDQNNIRTGVETLMLIDEKLLNHAYDSQKQLEHDQLQKQASKFNF